MADSSTDTQQLSAVKRALVELRDMRAKIEMLERVRTDPIAIIGMGCRFPGDIDTPESYWQLLKEGREAIGDVPRDRWDSERFFDANPEAPGKMNVRRGAFMSNVDRFDPYFFGITPREAVNMDPQQRLLLEVSWEALENAGLAPDRLMGSATGVFVGIGGNDYALLQMKNLSPEDVDVYLATGTSHSVAAGRLSYVLGFEGPCVAVDTACSSSLVAVHQACQSLRLGDCRMALAAGASLVLLPEININFSKAGMLAPDGRCKTFDASADGYVRGEGVGVIVLKRLSDALQDGDRVLALIRGSAINQDGRTSGLTVPNGPAQEAVIRQALEGCRIDPLQVQYVEAHGTGTSLGDPIEINSLASALCRNRPARDPLIVGSVKTNIGHLESAAGIAGLVKVVLSLQHKEIPAHLHLKRLNPHVQWDGLPILIPTEHRPWPTTSGGRIAGVSSFGFSGTNSHVILEEAPESSPESKQEISERPSQILVLSAKSKEALADLASRYAGHFVSHPESELRDICYTASSGRSHFRHRLAVVGSSAAKVSSALASISTGDSEDSGVCLGEAGNPPEVVFLFAGQGGQYRQMGRVLYESEPTFRKVMDQADELLRPHLAKSLRTLLYADPEECEELNQTQYTHVAMFAVQYGLAEVWRSWGVHPGAVMGHSVGEIVAATVAGQMSFEDGLMLVRERGRLMQQVGRDGLMASLLAGEARANRILASYQNRVSIAAVNGPESTVISGEQGAVREILAQLEQEGVKVKILKVSNAFHSPLVEPVLDEFESIAAKVQYREPKTALFSSMRLGWVTQGQLLDAGYWRHNLRHTVKFSDAIGKLYGEGYRVFVEVGPSPILVGMGSQCVPEGSGTWVASLREGRDDWEQILESLGRLYVGGVKIDWSGFDKGRNRHKVSLPTYPFQRQRYWIEEKKTPHIAASESPKEIWARAVATGRVQSQNGPLDLSLGAFPEKWQVLDRLTTAYQIAALRKFGLFSRSGETHTIDGLLQATGILPGYQKLLRRWMEKLRHLGCLQVGDSGYSCVGPLAGEDIETVRSLARQQFEDYPALFQYTQHCGEQLTDILTGKESPLETLFPQGSYELAEGLYQTSVVARYFNGIMREAVHAICSGRSQLNILEVGAGTGGTTSAILPRLSADHAVYTFTDVSTLFLDRAANKFENHTALRFGLLDIEKDPVGQGYTEHGCNVVIGANILHATRDLKKTIENVLNLLSSEGILVLLETTAHPSWFDITTGLIEGWQKFEDDLRGDNPLISADRWKEVLLACGFSEVFSFPEHGSPAEILGQHVLIARGPRFDQQSEIEISIPAQSPERPALSGQPKPPDIIVRLETALAVDRMGILSDYVLEEVSRVLNLDRDHRPDTSQRLMELGVDSLMAVELRNRIAKGLQLNKKLTATLIYDYPTIQAIAAYLATDILKLEMPEATKDKPKHTPMASVAEEIAQMDDAEVEDRLMEKLREL